VSRRFAAAAGLCLPAALALATTAVAQGESPMPEAGTELSPGRYASDVVGPRIAFAVEEGWQAGPAGPGPIFTLLRADEPGAIVSITRFDGDVFVDSCDPTSLTEVESSVPRLITVIAGNPYLNPGEPMPIEVDGHQGIALDVATPAYTECQLEFLLLWALPAAEGGEFVQVAEQQARFIAFDVEGDVIVVAIESLPGVPFGGLLEASLELVDSMRIEPGPAPLPGATDLPRGSPSASPAPSEPAELASGPSA
jgi:hypothetical protein